MKNKTRILTTKELIARELALSRVCDALHVLYLDDKLDTADKETVRDLLRKDLTAMQLHTDLYNVHIFTWGGYKEYELEDYLKKQYFSPPVAFLEHLKYDGLRKNLQIGFFVDWLNKVDWANLRVE